VNSPSELTFAQQVLDAYRARTGQTLRFPPDFATELAALGLKGFVAANPRTA
jgi:hypothetical protein